MELLHRFEVTELLHRFEVTELLHRFEVTELLHRFEVRENKHTIDLELSVADTYSAAAVLQQSCSWMKNLENTNPSHVSYEYLSISMYP